MQSLHTTINFALSLELGHSLVYMQSDASLNTKDTFKYHNHKGVGF